MYMFPRVLPILLLFLEPSALKAERQSYSVRRGAAQVDGVLGAAEWRAADRETGFSFPWQEREPPSTEFWALADGSRLYFAFRVIDGDLVIDPARSELAVARGDRVELFFASDPSLNDYLCLEIAPNGRVLDYRASHYRQFDEEWDLPELEVAVSTIEAGYVVEGSVPLAALPRGERVLTGIFRAELSRREDKSPREEWISWVRPDSPEPDFHIPSAFGWLQLER